MTLKTKKRIKKATIVATAFLLMAAGSYAVINQSQETAFADETESEATEITEPEPEEIMAEEAPAMSIESEDGFMRIQEVLMEIDTVALDKESNTHSAKADKEVTIVDTVTYEGAEEGDEYRLEATLMDKSTGEPVTVDGKAVTAQKFFTPTAYEGEVSIEITFDARSMGGRDVVVFEKVFYGNCEDEETAHEDISDGDQTVSLVEPTPVEKVFDEVPKTGDVTNILIAAIIAFAALAGVAVTFVVRRKKGSEL